MANIFERLHNGERIDMRSPEYQEVIAELHRADTALFKLNHQLPRTTAQAAAWNDLFAGHAPAGVGFMAPLQIDFPKQVRFGRNVFINHHLTMMSIGGIIVGNNVQFGPNVTLATDNHDLQDHNILECQPINIQDNAWIGANATILPGVTVGKNAVVAAGAIVTKNVPANTVVAGTPARVIRQLGSKEED